MIGQEGIEQIRSNQVRSGKSSTSTLQEKALKNPKNIQVRRPEAVWKCLKTQGRGLFLWLHPIKIKAWTFQTTWQYPDFFLRPISRVFLNEVKLFFPLNSKLWSRLPLSPVSISDQFIYGWLSRRMKSPPHTHTHSNNARWGISPNYRKKKRNRFPLNVVEGAGLFSSSLSLHVCRE